ncbi:MAG: glycogen-binding domain-containing protein [Pseudomonadota bacterium]
MAKSKTAATTPKKPTRRRIQFAFPDPDAGQVFLSGDFNQWSQTMHPMKKGSDGVWKKIVMLQPGRYEYKFRVDDHWAEDPANGRRCLNDFGSFNCVIEVP